MTWQPSALMSANAPSNLVPTTSAPSTGTAAALSPPRPQPPPSYGNRHSTSGSTAMSSFETTSRARSTRWQTMLPVYSTSLTLSSLLISTRLTPNLNLGASTRCRPGSLPPRSPPCYTRGRPGSCSCKSQRRHCPLDQVGGILCRDIHRSYPSRDRRSHPVSAGLCMALPPRTRQHVGTPSPKPHSGGCLTQCCTNAHCSGGPGPTAYPLWQTRFSPPPNAGGIPQIGPTSEPG